MTKNLQDLAESLQELRDCIVDMNAFAQQALLDVRRESAEEVSTRFKEMQERYPEFCLNVFYDSDMDYMFIKTTEYGRIKPS